MIGYVDKIGHKLAFQDFGRFLKEAVTHVCIVSAVSLQLCTISFSEH